LENADKIWEQTFSGFQSKLPTLPINKETYSSVDSAPVGFATTRPAWVGPSFLGAFIIACSLVILFESSLREYYLATLERITGIRTFPNPTSLGVRPIYLAFAATFWLFANCPWPLRVNLLLLMGGATLLGILLPDSILVLVGGRWGVGPFSLVGHIASGYLGLVAIALTIMISVKLPEGIRVPTVIRRPRRYTVVILASLIVATAMVGYILYFARVPLNFLRSAALLGGIGPGLLIFYPIVATLLATLGSLSVRRAKASQGLEASPSVGIVVPAYNEESGIAQCIQSIDQAAGNYPGLCRVYLINNMSDDNTVMVARQALALCQCVSGEVLECIIRGKSNALNFGVRQTTEEIIVRLDADTLCSPHLLAELVAHFSDPRVGIVGGLPLPKETSNLFRYVQEIEVYHNIGFSRIAQSAVDAVLCVTGVVTAYRREALLNAGDFSVGINGEDTDMTIRIGRLGYGVVVDPKIHVFSEVPTSWGQLKEQRTRWSRSMLHAFARNLSPLWMLQGVRGIWIIPNSAWILFRPILVVLILAYFAVATIIDPSVVSIWPLATVAALFLGPSFLLTLSTLLAYRRVGLVPFLPAYLVFRVVRAYICLEMLFTLSFRTRAVNEDRVLAETT
jgi:cellulose synthase/poly-beta-1,6-N-acetylglucosamine synthase-like glycosyltransferase